MSTDDSHNTLRKLLLGICFLCLEKMLSIDCCLLLWHQPHKTGHYSYLHLKNLGMFGLSNHLQGLNAALYSHRVFGSVNPGDTLSRGVGSKEQINQ